MGRKRIDETEKIVSVTVNLKQKYVYELEKKGKPSHLIRDIVVEYLENIKKGVE